MKHMKQQHYNCIENFKRKYIYTMNMIVLLCCYSAIYLYISTFFVLFAMLFLFYQYLLLYSKSCLQFFFISTTIKLLLLLFDFVDSSFRLFGESKICFEIFIFIEIQSFLCYEPKTDHSLKICTEPTAVCHSRNLI